MLKVLGSRLGPSIASHKVPELMELFETFGHLQAAILVPQSRNSLDRAKADVWRAYISLKTRPRRQDTVNRRNLNLKFPDVEKCQYGLGEDGTLPDLDLLGRPEQKEIERPSLIWKARFVSIQEWGENKVHFRLV